MANEIEFNNEQLNQIYDMIAGVNSDFITKMAKIAIESHLEVQQNMISEAEFSDVRSAPDENDIRTGAADFMADALADFSNRLQECINETQFKANIKLKATLEYKLEF